MQSSPFLFSELPEYVARAMRGCFDCLECWGIHARCPLLGKRKMISRSLWFPRDHACGLSNLVAELFALLQIRRYAAIVVHGLEPCQGVLQLLCGGQ